MRIAFISANREKLPDAVILLGILSVMAATPARLLDGLEQHGQSATQSAVYGMQPKSSRLLDLGMWCLTHRREMAMWWYNHVFMPLGVRFQKELSLVAGMIDTDGVDEIVLVCRKEAALG